MVFEFSRDSTRLSVLYEMYHRNEPWPDETDSHFSPFSPFTFLFVSSIFGLPTDSVIGIITKSMNSCGYFAMNG